MYRLIISFILISINTIVFSTTDINKKYTNSDIPTSEIELYKIDNSNSDLYNDIYSKYLQNIYNVEKVNPPIIIIFSGAPGMGKSTISKILEDKLSGIRISSDEIRMLFREIGINPQKIINETNHSYIEEQLIFTIDKLNKTSKNKLLILDMSCDRTYNIIKNIAENYKYPIFTIRLNLSLEETKQRIIDRGIKSDNFLKFIDKWYDDYINFDEKQCDYFLDMSVMIDELPIEDLLSQIVNKMTQK